MHGTTLTKAERSKMSKFLLVTLLLALAVCALGDNCHVPQQFQAYIQTWAIYGTGFADFVSYSYDGTTVPIKERIEEAGSITFVFGDPDSGVMLNYMYKYGDGPETCALWKVSGPVGPIDVPSTAVATANVTMGTQAAIVYTNATEDVSCILQLVARVSAAQCAPLAITFMDLSVPDQPQLVTDIISNFVPTSFPYNFVLPAVCQNATLSKVPRSAARPRSFLGRGLF